MWPQQKAPTIVPHDLSTQESWLELTLPSIEACPCTSVHAASLERWRVKITVRVRVRARARVRVRVGPDATARVRRRG